MAAQMNPLAGQPSPVSMLIGHRLVRQLGEAASPVHHCRMTVFNIVFPESFPCLIR